MTMTTTMTLPPEFSGEERLALREKLFYVSEAIREVEFDGGGALRVVHDELPAGGSIEAKIGKLIGRFKEHRGAPAERVLHEEPGSARGPAADVTQALVQSGAIVKLGEGQFALTGPALELFDYFDRSVREIGREFGAREHRYPTLIPVRAMQRIGYLASRPECLNFVSRLREDIDLIDSFSEEARGISERVELSARAETDCLNSVAVCLHLFHQLQDSDLGGRTVFAGAAGKCMRYEARNMESLRRLRDFTMREVVCVGDAESVQDFRRRALAAAKSRLAEWGLSSFVATANDLFFTEEFAGQSTFQKTFALKYELRARLSAPGDSLAVGSLNHHRDFIGKGFSITAGGRAAHSSCLAYGLERCVYAFLTQHGLARSNWPDAVARRLAGQDDA